MRIRVKVSSLKKLQIVVLKLNGRLIRAWMYNKRIFYLCKQNVRLNIYLNHHNKFTSEL